MLKNFDLYRLPVWVVRWFFSKQKARECDRTVEDNGCKHCYLPCVFNKNHLLRPKKNH
jgi:hypothetical protein